ncbi:MAG: cupin domain-containing protein [Hyphomicrobiales bacterium]|nr:cupin domain-containing protein [Hyphomicrobiales bacterium]MCP5373118.1 cupin domain-containing protein [Hyphomicrobiales bacterium]
MPQQDFDFATSFVKDATFTDGLRDFLEYRDLGIAQATGGKFRAHVLRVKKDGDTSTLHTTGLHRHYLDFQMIFILKGWIKFTYEDNGTFTFGPGDCCLQPPGILHNELECSDDLELLEITSPAKYETEAVQA